MASAAPIRTNTAAATASPAKRKPSTASGSDPYHGHEDTSKLGAAFITSLFACPELPPPSANLTADGRPVPSPKLALFIAYALHRTRLNSSVTYAALYLLQRLKQRFPAARGSSGHRLFISAFMIASKVVCDDTYSNKSWAVVGQGMFSLREINQMEREMCGYLEWRLNVPRPDLEAFAGGLIDRFGSSLQRRMREELLTAAAIDEKPVPIPVEPFENIPELYSVPIAVSSNASEPLLTGLEATTASADAAPTTAAAHVGHNMPKQRKSSHRGSHLPSPPSDEDASKRASRKSAASPAVTVASTHYPGAVHNDEDDVRMQEAGGEDHDEEDEDSSSPASSAALQTPPTNGHVDPVEVVHGSGGSGSSRVIGRVRGATTKRSVDAVVTVGSHARMSDTAY